MKNTHLFILLWFLPMLAIAQNLRTIEVYYDPLTMTKIHEKYTIETNYHQKHGNYKEWDEYGYLIKEATFNNGKLKGIVTSYFGANYYFMYQVKNKARLGKVSKTESYRDDVKQGSFKYYYLSDDEYYLSDEAVFDNNKEIKTVTYFNNGKIKKSIQDNGPCVEYYDNGNKYADYNQKNGKEDGPATVYYENGQLLSKRQYSNGVDFGSWISYYPNGKIASQGSYLENYGGVKEQKSYASNGNLKNEVIFNSVNSIKNIDYDTIAKQPISIEEFKWVITPESIETKQNGKSSYYSKGKLITEGLYKDGVRVGQWKIFNNKDWKETFNPDSIEFYREITFDNNGKPIGKVIDYYKSGQKQWEGLLLSLNPDKFNGECIFYYPNGQIKTKQYYDKNIKIGVWETFYENGKNNERLPYSNDKLEGTYSAWWDNGKVKAAGNYKRGNKIGEWNYYNAKGDIEKLEIYDNYGTLRKTKTAQQLLTDIENKYTDTITLQTNAIAQKYTLNQPEEYQELVGKSYFNVSSYILKKADNTENHELIVGYYKQAIAIGKKLINLDDSSIKKLSRKLKKETNFETMIAIINDFQ